MKVLVTGCTGYIGSHTCVELLNAGIEIVGLDNFSNSKKDVLDKIHTITGEYIKFYEGDMIDEDLLNKIFEENDIDAVIDFAAYKAVGESVKKPVEYYTNNVATVLALLRSMKAHNVKKIVFSSSATVYGDPVSVPINETFKIGDTTNPYGTSKYMVELILQDLAKSDPDFGVCILRYFNPIGAHESGLIGEEPNGIPANLVPYISKVAAGKLEQLSVFGNDYNTKDGTGVRDYVHVVDLAVGHVCAVNKLEKEVKGLFIYNLGTGTGYSVLDLVTTFEKVNDVKVPYKIVDRRPGDIAECYAETAKAKEEIGFECTHTLEDMLRSAWNYEKNSK